MGTILVATSMPPSMTMDPEALAIFAAFTTPPTTDRKNKINAVVLALKAANIWVELDVLYVMAAADSQAAKINWRRPGTYNLTEVGSPSFTADVGFKSSVDGVKLSTGWNPTVAAGNFLQNDATMFSWQFDHGPTPANSGIYGGGSAPVIDLYANDAGDPTMIFYLNDSIGQFVDNITDIAGLWGFSRIAASTVTAYANGAPQVVTSPVTSSGLLNAGVFLLVDDGDRASATSVSLFGAGGALDATKHAALFAAFDAYMPF